MIFKYIFCFIFLFYSLINGQSSQEKSIDSLWNLAAGKHSYAEKGSKEMLRLCTEVYYQSKNINYEKGTLRALVKMSEIYQNEQNYKESLSKINEGLILAEKTRNYVIWSDLLTLESGIYQEFGYYDKSRENCRKALSIADQITETDRKHIARSNIFRQQASTIDKENTLPNKYDSVKFYYGKAYAESKALSDTFPQKNKYIAKNVKNIASIYLLQNKTPEAEQYLAEFEALTKNEKNSVEYISFYTLKGNIENKKRNYDKAVEYFNHSIHLSEEYKILPSKLIESYSGIAESYLGLHDYKNQAFYLTKAKKITDSLANAEKKIIEEIPSEHTEKNENHLLFYAIPILIVVLLILFYFLFIRKKTVSQEETTTVEEEKAANDTSPDLVSENGVEDPDLNRLDHIIELAQNNDKSFYLKFSEIFPAFNETLLSISSQLTPSDLEYCALMKLNFDTKQIAVVKKTSVSSVESRKYRIRKKLNIDSSENIYKWLMKIQTNYK
ncbi:tetratricopeptide repeat protein [Chryseobacterium soli]|uniref:tetratricopeptide repeat protein n=1 Tax=Chryseobacterium soli TaxID=445961 RepID=UPI00068AF1BB|nr:hypothetical protein [Chryseobacterium soli]